MLLPSVVECSGETLAPTTVFASSSHDLGKSRPAIVDVSIFTIVEILGKQSSGFGVEYQFKLEPAALSLYPAHTLTTCLCSCKVQRIEQCLSLISGVA
jgi:hypothetical protein